MLKVLSFLDGNRAVVDTTGLFRLVDSRDGKTLDELLAGDECQSALNGFNLDDPNGPAKLVSYAELASN